MEIKALQSELEELYRLTMVYEFHKTTYEQYMESLKERYAGLLQETARACDESENSMEAVAGCIPEYVFKELQKEPSKRKRNMKALDHKMNMVSFFVPLMGEMPSENVKAITGRFGIQRCQSIRSDIPTMMESAADSAKVFSAISPQQYVKA